LTYSSTSFPCAPKQNAFQPETKTTNNLASWLANARAELTALSGDIQDAALSASLLAAQVLTRSRTWVLTHPESGLEDHQVRELNGFLERLISGEPLAYLTGHREFYGLDFEISPAVLVPRPETELLVEQALAWLADHPSRRCAVDVGTGSGCIAICLAHHIRDMSISAVDLSRPALQLARRNAEVHGVQDRVRFTQGDLLSALSGPFDLVCANLPYIPSQDVDVLPVSRSEPRIALDGGSNGLELIDRLLAQLPVRLSPGGLALLEIEYRQGQAACELASGAFPSAAVNLFSDLSGLDRLVQIQAA
jgi:release factor glutamine methyltransferase